MTSLTDEAAWAATSHAIQCAVNKTRAVVLTERNSDILGTCASRVELRTVLAQVAYGGRGGGGGGEGGGGGGGIFPMK